MTAVALFSAWVMMANLIVTIALRLWFDLTATSAV